MRDHPQHVSFLVFALGEGRGEADRATQRRRKTHLEREDDLPDDEELRLLRVRLDRLRLLLREVLLEERERLPEDPLRAMGAAATCAGARSDHFLAP